MPGPDRASLSLLYVQKNGPTLQHVLGHDLAFILTEHVLQHLPGQENAIIMTGHVLGL